MRVWQINKKQGLDALELVERQRPQPKSSEVLVKVFAVGLNYRDLLVIKEAYRDNDLPFGLLPCSDTAGKVVAIGSEVKLVSVGDKVTSCFMPDWLDGNLSMAKQNSALGYARDGVLAEYVILPAHGVITIPEHLSYEEASVLPCAALTAWHALSRGNILPGKTVLIQGTGGVAIFAFQFAKLFGANVIALSSNDEKLRRLEEMGASLGINYRTTPNWNEDVMKFTKGEGVDHIIDIGGADTLDKSLSVAKYGGSISIIGQVTGDKVALNIGHILGKDLNLQGVYVGSKQMFKAMNEAISLHKLKPVIDKSFPFEKAREALEYLESGNHFGKICINI